MGSIVVIWEQGEGGRTVEKNGQRDPGYWLCDQPRTEWRLLALKLRGVEMTRASHGWVELLEGLVGD